MESMLGFRQDLGYAGAVQSMAAIAVHPELGSSGSQNASGGLDEAVLRTAETMQMGDEFEIEAGSETVLARLHGSASSSAAVVLPSASLGWNEGNSTIRYSMASSLPGWQDLENASASMELPALSLRNGKLVIEHGLHQQIGWERRTETSDVAVQVFSDHIENPVIEASGRLTGSNTEALALEDSTSGLLRVAGPDYSTFGLVATASHKLPGTNAIRISYATGDALVLPDAPSHRISSASLAQTFASARPHRAQMYSVSFSGTIEGTGTHWVASYRWQPEDTVTRVAPFATNAAEPWLNIHLRQPVSLHHNGTEHLDLLLDVRNLLAEGYQPMVLSDGSILFFAQDQRSIRGGLAFTF
jgi:hypothetical protein